MVDRKGSSMWKNLTTVMALVATFDVCVSYVCYLEPLQINGSLTSQSSTYSKYLAGNAVDGNVTTFSQTVDDGGDNNPWWRLELEGKHWLGRVTVIVCKDSCGDYFNDVVVRAGLNEEYKNERCNSSLTATQPSDGAVVDFLCDPPALTKYISLDKGQASPGDGKTSLKIAEVLVYEYASEECATRSAISLNGSSTSQSTSDIKYPAIRAQDGNVNSFTKTDKCCDPHPWWMLDLGNGSWVGTIIVTLRPYCCGSRFKGVIARAGVNYTFSVNPLCGSEVTGGQALSGAVLEFRCLPPVYARYISLEINQSTPEDSPVLEIAEVAVKQYKSEECVPNNTLALNANSTSESSRKNPAHDALDGNINTFSTTSGYKLQSQHWWMLDMGAKHWVGKVTVIFKTVDADEVVRVRTGNSSVYSENIVCGQSTVDKDKAMEFLCTTLILARYVSVDVMLPKQEVLQIAEVYIKEFASGDCQASFKAEVNATLQISDYATNYVADKATDGHVNTYSRTKLSDEHPWWRMELGNEVWLTRVTVTLRNTLGYFFIGAVARIGLNPDNLNVTCGSPATEKQSEPGAVIQFLCDRPTLARYVFLSIDSGTTGVRRAILQIAEVTVDEYETEECAPKNGATRTEWKAWQNNNNVLSSANAIDGNIETFFETAHGDDHPLWQLDLGNEYWLGAIAVTLRADCCEYRFLDVVARAGLNLNYTLNQPCDLSGEHTNKTGAVVEFLCNPPVSARYISLDIDQSSPGVINAMLQIAEVIVKEYYSEQCVTNDTFGVSDWTATQSSDTTDNPARDATDGNILSYSSTYNDDPHPWWRFNLGGEHWLGKITLILASTAASQSNTIVVRVGNSANYAENTPCNSSATEAEHGPGAVIECVCDPPIRASYVTVDMDSSSVNPVLRIAEIFVKKYESEDCARNSTSTIIEGKARQSSDVTPYPGCKANDGKTSTYFKSANFVDDPYPWWQVDLADEHCIGRITVKLMKDNTVVDNIIAMVSAEDNSDFSKNKECGLQTTPTSVTAQFMCDPPVLAKYITLAVHPSVPAVETAYLQIAEVTVEQYSSGVGPCLKWDDPNRKTKSAYVSKRFRGSMSMSEGALHPLSTEVTSDHKQCTHHCIHHDGCISFVFLKPRGECSLYSEYPSELLSRSDEVGDSYWVYDLSE